MTTPIPNCPQPDESIRDRAWTAEQVEQAADRCSGALGYLQIENMLLAYAATLRQQGEQAGGVVSDGDHSEAVMRAMQACADADKAAYDKGYADAIAQNAQVEAGMDFQTCVAVEVGADESDQDDILRHLTAWMKVARDANHAERTRVPADWVLVPRGILGAACYAIEAKRDAPITLGELRRYAIGNPSAALAPPYQWPSFEVVQTWALANGYSGSSDNEAYEAYRKAHPPQPEDAA